MKKACWLVRETGTPFRVLVKQAKRTKARSCGTAYEDGLTDFRAVPVGGTNFRAKVLGLVVGAAFVVGACGKKSDSSSDTEPEPCGDTICSDRQVCDDAGREPICECASAYEGEDCEQCATGYEDVDGTCQPVEIDCDDSPCGLRGACVSETGKADYCECNEFHDGPTCAQCIEGYQDNDGDDECAVGCDSTELPFECEGFWVCDDTGGEAMCVCPVGSTGDECELCESGYARRGDEPCYEVCSNIECEEPLYCFDDSGLQAAECVCPLGYQGDACDECESGFEKMGEACVRSDLSGFDLLTLGPVRGRTAVLGLDSATGTLTPLLAVDGTPEGLVYDSENEALFVANHQGVLRSDWATGESTLMAQAQIGHGKPLALDADGLLYSIRSTDEMLFTIDPADDSTVDVAAVMSSWLWDATYRTQDDMIYVIRSQGLTPTIHSVDPSDATIVEIGSVTGSAPIGSQSAGGIAALSGGDLAVLSRTQMEREEALAHACARAADRLGFGGYESAPATVLEPDGGTSTMLASQGSSGEEMVIYRSYGGTGDNVITIDVKNPDAFICISTYEEDFQVVISSEAFFAGGVLYSYESTVTGVVEDGFSGDSKIAASGGSNVDLTALEDHQEGFQVLSSTEFSDRQMPSLSDPDSYARDQSPYFLRLLSLPELTEQSSVELQGRFSGGLCAF